MPALKDFTQDLTSEQQHWLDQKELEFNQQDEYRTCLCNSEFGRFVVAEILAFIRCPAVVLSCLSHCEDCGIHVILTSSGAHCFGTGKYCAGDQSSLPDKKINYRDCGYADIEPECCVEELGLFVVREIQPSLTKDCTFNYHVSTILGNNQKVYKGFHIHVNRMATQ